MGPGRVRPRKNSNFDPEQSNPTTAAGRATYVCKLEDVGGQDQRQTYHIVEHSVNLGRQEANRCFYSYGI